MRHVIVWVALMSVVLALTSTGMAQSTASQRLAKDQTFRMTIREPTSMDPNLCADACIWYVDQIFEGMYKILDDGRTRWF